MSQPATTVRCHRATRAELLQTFDGDTDFVNELVAMFNARCPALLEEIRGGFHAGDILTVKRAAHSLKGSIGYFEQGSAYSAAQHLERVTEPELVGVPSLLKALEHEIQSLMRYLHDEFTK